MQALNSLLLVTGASVALAGATHAQVPMDAWAVAVAKDTIFNTGSGGIFVLSADLMTLSQPLGQTVNTEFCNCVQVDTETGVIYYGTSGTSAAPTPNSIFRIEYDPVANTLQNEQTLVNNVGGYVSAIEIVGDRIYYITSGDGSSQAVLGWIPKAGGGATVVDTVPDVMQPGGHSGLGNAMCSDGQDLFIGMSFNAQSTDDYNILAYNLETGERRPLGTTPIPEYPGQMDVDIDGNVIVATNRGNMFAFDPDVTLPPMMAPAPLAGGRAPTGIANGFGLLPHQRFGLIVPSLSSTGAPREIYRYDFDVGAMTGTWGATPVATFIGGLPADISCRSEAPVSYRGSGCPAASGDNPRADLGGAPLLGEQLDFELVDATPNSGAIVLFGTNTENFLGVPLPLNLNILGAPSCNLLTDIVVNHGRTTSMSGEATFSATIPNVPILSPGALTFQWAVVSPGVPGNLTMTQVGVVRWR